MYFRKPLTFITNFYHKYFWTFPRILSSRQITYFVSVELGSKLKLNILLKKVYEKVKRFFEIPDFKQYAIPDGIYRILFSYKVELREEALKPTNQPCLCVHADRSLSLLLS